MSRRRRAGVPGRLRGLLALCLALEALSAPAVVPAAQEVDPLVFFAGEDLSVLSVASRRPETPQRAPATVRVITSQDILVRGFRTLADVLRHEAGFVIRPGERGSTPYLRGVRDGILFLYDGVPMRSPLTKSVHPLDEDLSLADVDRVEIVLGPGSVLWGPDAYAGIVNVVPRRTVDADGMGVRVWGGSEDLRGAGCVLKGRRGTVSGRLTVSGQSYRAWDDTYPSLHPPAAGVAPAAAVPGPTDTLEDSYAWETVGTVTVGDRLSFTGRLADARSRYTMTSTDGITWAGEKRAPVSLLKASALQRIGSSDLSLTASFSHVPFALTDADVSRRQDDNVFAADLLWYRPWGEGGGITLGAGYRHDRTEDAVVRDGFLPDFLKPPYRVFVPPLLQADFDNAMGSAYGQVRRRIGPVDVWLGLRVDDPDAYRSTTSFSAGAAWHFHEDWRIKATYGTAYRTPYAAQLYADRALDPESIETAAVELNWNPGADKSVSFTVYHSTVSDHLQEDPYGGLSRPSHHRFTGAELWGRWAVHAALDLFGSAAAVGVTDDNVAYRVLRAFYLAPDGTRIPIEETWSSLLDCGPEWSATAGLHWHPAKDFGFVVQGLVTGPWSATYDEGRTLEEFAGEKHVRASLTLRNVGPKGSVIQVVADNVLDQGGSVPGIFGPAERPPFRAWVEWRLDF